jgi:hypothetical protein
METIRCFFFTLKKAANIDKILPVLAVFAFLMLLLATIAFPIVTVEIFKLWKS